MTHYIIGCMTNLRLRSFLVLRTGVIGTLRSDDGDGNGNATKTIGLVSKTTILRMDHAFCTFLCRRCTSTT